VVGPHQPLQLRAQRLDLRLFEHAHARQIAMLAVKLDLLVGQRVAPPVARGGRRGEESGDGRVAA
jgi:hypothetical protein